MSDDARIAVEERDAVSTHVCLFLCVQIAAQLRRHSCVGDELADTDVKNVSVPTCFNPNRRVCRVFHPPRPYRQSLSP